MASITRYRAGWRAQVRHGEVRDSRTFATRREASDWAKAWELEAKDSREPGERRTLSDAFRRYRAEVAPRHKGHRHEVVRLARFEADAQLPMTLPLTRITSAHMQAWRDSLTTKLKPGSVLRDMSLLASVFAACREWQWLRASPLERVRRPPQPRHRDRIIAWSEQRSMLRELGHRPRGMPHTKRQMVAWAFLVALRTGMRAGEICGLEWGRVHGAWLALPETKNGTAREVPLPPKAARLIERARGLDGCRVTTLAARSLDSLFRTARDSAGLSGFTFHDSRHTAATRIGRQVGQLGRLSFPEFCKVFGWKDPRNALVYVNPSAAELASRMG